MAKAKDKTETGWRCLWGFLLLALSVFTALSLFSYHWEDISRLKVPATVPPHNLIGPVGAWLSYALLVLLGVGAYAVPVCCVVLGVILVVSREEAVWPKAVWCGLFMVALVSLLALHEAAWTARCQRLDIVDPGGLISRVTTHNLLKWVNPVGTGIVAWSLLLAAAAMLIGPRIVVRFGRWAAAVMLVGVRRVRTSGGAQGETRAARVPEKPAAKKPGVKSRKADPVEVEEESAIEKRRRRLDEMTQREQELAVREQESAKREAEKREAAEEKRRATEEKRLERERRAKEAAARKPTVPPAATSAGEAAPTLQPFLDGADYTLPPVTLLDEVQVVAGGVKADTATTSKILVETLQEFGIETQVTNIEEGPVVTRYELLPAPGVRVERISGLSNNLALSLKATSVRVQAPIPGKGVVGIEVPNTAAKVVYLRGVLEGELWRSGKAKLPLVLGQDVGGNDMVADLAEMPHLLIAGATGAGKTVCMNSVLAGLLMSRRPDELRLLLVDPKIVEFSVFNDLPHLVVPVVTNPKKVALALRWAINEMEKRYKLFAKAGVRNIASFNSRPIVEQGSLFEDEEPAEETDKAKQIPNKVPYIVIIIDELADLMLADQAEIENCVARLAQLSRAVGIHMILSTQRPSVNVITGTIKANFPARIAFQVAQRVDSRTILDTIGADKLLGRGDMLFLPPGTSRLVRAQGALTSDDEIRRIVDFIKNQSEPHFESVIKEQLEGSGGGGAKADGDDVDVDDELLNQSIEIIRETRRASTSSLQRRLRIGYTRAARIMDNLEERGIIGPPRGSDPREILIDLDGEIPQHEHEQEGEDSDI